MKNEAHRINVLEERLNRQIERGNLFAHTNSSVHATRMNEIESFLYGTIDLLIQEGVLSEKNIQERVKQLQEEMQLKNETVHAGVALRIDPKEQPEEKKEPINCTERIHLCKAVCCQLNFALNTEEIESGKVKWDMGRPYFIRQEKDCYCTHNNKDKGCEIYEDRPKVCKDYTCKDDERIWTNFEKMELNEAWISENIQEHKLRFAGAQMFPNQETVNKMKVKE